MIKLSLITVTIILLTATGFLGPPRPSDAEPLPREAQPDVRELIRSGADKIDETPACRCCCSSAAHLRQPV